jgi:uncharacterized integral membrane protein
MQAVIIIILILAVLLVIFTLQNSMEITLNVFFWEIANAPLVLVLIACVVLGYLLAAFYFFPRIWKLKKEYNQLIKFNKELKEYHDLHHPKKTRNLEQEPFGDPEGIEFDDDEDDDGGFFKD